MAYISTEEVAKRRAQIKKLFPAKDGWKFSITCHHYSEIRVVILQAPIELRDNPANTDESVNEYRISDLDNQTAVKVLTIITEICNKGNYNNSDPMTDYFDYGFYFSLSIGSWDKPFKVIETGKPFELPNFDTEPETTTEVSDIEVENCPINYEPDLFEAYRSSSMPKQVQAPAPQPVKNETPGTGKTDYSPIFRLIKSYYSFN